MFYINLFDGRDAFLDYVNQIWQKHIRSNNGKFKSALWSIKLTKNLSQTSFDMLLTNVKWKHSQAMRNFSKLKFLF